MVVCGMQPIATVREASLGDYEESMTACVEARRMWMLVIHPFLCFHLSEFFCVYVLLSVLLLLCFL